jgi:hypothetical protein
VISCGRLFFTRGFLRRFLAPFLAAALLAAAVGFVDGRPGALFSLFRADALLFVAFLDVFGLALLFAGVAGFIAAGHESSGVGFGLIATVLNDGSSSIF